MLFSGRRQVKSINFESESDLRVIESHALQDTSIERFVVPRLVDTIELRAFDGCPFLKELIFDEDCVITSLNNDMFEGTHLDSLFISCHVEDVEVSSLYGIKNISISPKNQYFNSERDLLKSGCDVSTLGSFDDEGVFVFDSHVETIPDEEFKDNCDILEVSFSLSTSICSIGQGAFQDSSLCSISIPSSIESIGPLCFFGCENLARVDFLPAICLQFLPKLCFFVTGLKSISIPSSIKVIEEDCFNASQLCRVTFDHDSSLEHVKENAFFNTKLTRLVLPKSIRYLGKSCFSECDQLKFVSFEDDSNLEEIGECCFRGCQLNEIVIPPKVSKLGSESLAIILLICVRRLSI